MKFKIAKVNLSWNNHRLVYDKFELISNIATIYGTTCKLKITPKKDNDGRIYYVLCSEYHNNISSSYDRDSLKIIANSLNEKLYKVRA